MLALLMASIFQVESVFDEGPVQDYDQAVKCELER